MSDPEKPENEASQNYLGVSIPNLDCMDLENIRELADCFQKLYQYCLYKGSAIARRKEGEILHAQKLEYLAQGVYENLPEELRW